MFNVWQCALCILLYLWCEKNLQSITKWKTNKRFMREKMHFILEISVKHMNRRKIASQQKQLKIGIHHVQCTQKSIDVYERGRKGFHSVYQLSLEQINIWSTKLSLIFDVQKYIDDVRCSLCSMVPFYHERISFSSQWKSTLTVSEWLTKHSNYMQIECVLRHTFRREPINGDADESRKKLQQ